MSLNDMNWHRTFYQCPVRYSMDKMVYVTNTKSVPNLAGNELWTGVLLHSSEYYKTKGSSPTKLSATLRPSVVRGQQYLFIFSHLIPTFLDVYTYKESTITKNISISLPNVFTFCKRKHCFCSNIINYLVPVLLYLETND